MHRRRLGFLLSILFVLILGVFKVTSVYADSSTLIISPSTPLANQPITFSGQATPAGSYGGAGVGVKIYSGSTCSAPEISSAVGTADSSAAFSVTLSTGLAAGSYSAFAIVTNLVTAADSSCVSFTVSSTPIPEYPLGLPILLLLIVIAYAVIKSKRPTN